jgi:hypothetical protein
LPQVCSNFASARQFNAGVVSVEGTNNAIIFQLGAGRQAKPDFIKIAWNSIGCGSRIARGYARQRF